MGERSMLACLVEHLDVLRSSLPPGTSAQDWYDAGCPDDVFSSHGANVGGLYAAGYLQGAADAADVTIGDMLDSYELSFDAPQPTKRQRIRKVGR